MFSFFRRSAPEPVSDAISRAIEAQGFTPALGDTARLRMVQSRGRYSDRQVTYFRIFDPSIASGQSLEVKRYRDLDAFQNLVLRAGHVENDGHIVVIRPAGAQAPRTRAGRTVPSADATPVGDGEATTPASPVAVQTSTSEHAV
jgi:hypothetical protein